MGKKSFKTKELDLVLLRICLDKPKCSKEVAEFLKKPHSDRDFQKSLNKLAKKKLMLVKKNENKKYPKSKFFVTNKNKLAKFLIESSKKAKTRAQLKGVRYFLGVDLDTQDQAIAYFKSLFQDVKDSDGTIYLEFDFTGQKEFKILTKLSEFL